LASLSLQNFGHPCSIFQQTLPFKKLTGRKLTGRRC
jgi:hypothetical protein